MPSEKVLSEKKLVVDELIEKLSKSCAGVLVDYKGINVADDTKLRRELREAGISYTVVKNTLMTFASEKVGLQDLKSVLEGTTALAVSETDYVAAARILAKYVETSKSTFAIKAGFIDGKVIDANSVNALAKLPSREVLVAQVLCGFNTPITNFAGVLNANLRGLVCALNAIAEQKTA